MARSHGVFGGLSPDSPPPFPGWFPSAQPIISGHLGQCSQTEMEKDRGQPGAEVSGTLPTAF